MDSGAWAFLIAIFLFIIVPLVFLVIFMLAAPAPLTIIPAPTPPSLGNLFSVCTSDANCQSQLTCTQVGTTERRCLTRDNGICTSNIQCAGGNCTNGRCSSVNPPVPPTPPGANSRIFCYNEVTRTWRQHTHIPFGLTFVRVSSWNSQLLGISTSANAAYLYINGQWQNITSSISPPGILVDGTIVQGAIYLVYRTTQNTTLLYQLVNNTLIPVGNNSGIQTTTSGQQIFIRWIDVHPQGDIYIVGNVSNGASTVFLKSSSVSNFSAFASGETVYAIPTRPPNNFGFSSGSSIMVMGEFSKRIDNIVGTTSSMIITSQGTVWYVAGGILYDELNGPILITPFSVNSSSKLFYSLEEGVCILV